MYRKTLKNARFDQIKKYTDYNVNNMIVGDMGDDTFEILVYIAVKPDPSKTIKVFSFNPKMKDFNPLTNTHQTTQQIQSQYMKFDYNDEKDLHND